MVLRDDQWERIEKHIPGKKGLRGRPITNHRQFVEALIWIARTGSPLCDLLVEFGAWNTVYMRFAHCSDKKTSGTIFLRFYEKMQTLKKYVRITRWCGRTSMSLVLLKKGE